MASDDPPLSISSRLLEALDTFHRQFDLARTTPAAFVGELPGFLRRVAGPLGLDRLELWLTDASSLGERTIVAEGAAPPSRHSAKLIARMVERVARTGERAVVPEIGDDPDAWLVGAAVRVGRERHGALVAEVQSSPAGPDASVVRGLLQMGFLVGGHLLPARRAALAGGETPPPAGSIAARATRPHNIIGNSRTMRGVYAEIEQVCQSEASVLLRGESGVGKELVAHAIHDRSLRARRAFVRVNCAALSQSLLESELFGHERCAFTGALTRRKGRFELADGGTIFLDEIADLPHATQVALLRVLREREFERVGGTETIRVDVRVITATNRDLEVLMAEGGFREDLYYRLNVFPIHVPALRERKTDITLLADYFVERYSRQAGKTIRRISTPAIDMMMAYHWPGNVRELENCIERAVLLTEDDVIRGHHLPPTLQTAEATGTTARGTLRSALDALEREMVVDDALESARGNMASAARALGITERIMGLRVNRFGLDPRRFRGRAGRDQSREMR